MEIQQLRKEFNQLLDKINQQSERFTEQSHLPSLEASVILSKINKLQEVAAVLKYTIELNEGSANQKRKDYNQAVRNEEKIVKREAVDEFENETPIEVAEVENIIPETPVDIIIEKKEEEVFVPVEENIEASSNSSISDKLSETPILSLKDAFSLNDRYLFANELFNKDMTLFNDAIKTIDACENEMEAMDKLREFGTSLDWDLESDYLLSLQNMVQRRFL